LANNHKISEGSRSDAFSLILTKMQTRALVFLALAAAASAFTAPAMAGRMQLRSSKAGEALIFFLTCCAGSLTAVASDAVSQRARASRGCYGATAAVILDASSSTGLLPVFIA